MRAKIVETERETRIFRTNRSLAVRLPPDFGTAGDAVRIVRDGERLIIEPVGKGNSVLTLLAEWAKEQPPHERDQFPVDLNESLLPLPDVDI
nr:AbrB/MazE/SpoVT family DNA-binding domain-containing protein [Camelimonas fluminis]